MGIDGKVNDDGRDVVAQDSRHGGMSNERVRSKDSLLELDPFSLQQNFKDFGSSFSLPIQGEVDGRGNSEKPKRPSWKRLARNVMLDKKDIGSIADKCKYGVESKGDYDYCTLDKTGSKRARMWIAPSMMLKSMLGCWEIWNVTQLLLF
ncbi:hypothetical protein J1N35_022134 [Gossypium stocksii]|uniref:Uncharacterized protein n=1 Tax=Gossypium stocksii TaxID=47602 RepID=A0A9D4A1Z6_9ROSI|nr:hypothetical protein J1N35_022134 [Gossypium stocksii]